MLTLSLREEKKLLSLSTPAKIQKFLDSLPYRCEDDALPVISVLRDSRAHCFDGTLLAAAALRRAKIAPYIIDLCAEGDDDHLICAYRVRSGWGALAKSNFPGLRSREPIFSSPRELVLSYFEFYFTLKGVKSLRGYSEPMPLPNTTRINWECDFDAPLKILELLEKTRHHRLISRSAEKNLSKVTQVVLKSQMVGVDLRGTYGGKS